MRKYEAPNATLVLFNAVRVMGADAPTPNPNPNPDPVPDHPGPYSWQGF